MDAQFECKDKGVRDALLFGLPNYQDNFVIQKLAKAPLSSLPVDKLAYVLRKGGESKNKNVLALRAGLIKVYIDAAKSRRDLKATKAQRDNARKALECLTEALGLLDLRPSGQRGLQSVFGSPVDDLKGLDESNSFDVECNQIRLKLVPQVMRLREITEFENLKLSRRGERKKRLGTLVEFLADWWISETGRSIAPHVKAKRLDHRPSFVLGREGEFLSFAAALFCEVDAFKESEVIAAVTNAHENVLAKQKTPAKSEQ